jgi:hypothetical protein
MIVFMGIAERLLTIVNSTKADLQISAPLNFLVWSFSSGVGGGFVCLVLVGVISLVMNVFSHFVSSRPAAYEWPYIDVVSKIKLEELAIFPSISTDNPKDPSQAYLISMQNFSLWIEKGASPLFQYQRLVFGCSTTKFDGAFSAVSATVQCQGYEIAEGIAFLVKSEAASVNGVPVVSLRQIPFKLQYTKLSDGGVPREFTNSLNIPDKYQGEKLLLILRIQDPDLQPIIGKPRFPITVSVENTR